MHITPLVEQVRFYSDSYTFENKDPYDTLLTVVWLDHETVSVQGLIGNFNAIRYKSLLKAYKERGVKKVMFNRHKESVTLEL